MQSDDQTGEGLLGRQVPAAVWVMGQMIAHCHKLTNTRCTSEPAQGRPPYQALMGQVWSRLSELGWYVPAKALSLEQDEDEVVPPPALFCGTHPPAGALRDLKVFLGPIGQMPWALVGGGVWGLIRVPTFSVSPSLFLRSAGKHSDCNKYTRCPGDRLRLGLCDCDQQGVGRTRVSPCKD